MPRKSPRVRTAAIRRSAGSPRSSSPVPTRMPPPAMRANSPAPHRSTRTPPTACGCSVPPKRRSLWCAAAIVFVCSSKRRAITICRPICAAGSPRRRSGAGRSSSRSTSTRRAFCESLRFRLSRHPLSFALRNFLPLRNRQRALGPYGKLVGIVIEPVRQSPIGQGVFAQAARLLAAGIGEETGAFVFEIGNAGLVGFEINRAAHHKAEHHAVAVKPGAREHAPHRHRTKLREQIADEVEIHSACHDAQANRALARSRAFIASASRFFAGLAVEQRVEQLARRVAHFIDGAVERRLVGSRRMSEAR